MSEEIKVETEEVIEQPNLVADLNGEIISNELLDSNKIYGEGYNPYYARRRMDKTDGEKDEIVNETSIMVEVNELGQYGTRMWCSRHHFRDLINFIKGCDRTNDVDILELAQKIVRHYFSNVIEFGQSSCLSTFIHLIGKDNMEFILNDIVGSPKTEDKMVRAIVMLLNIVDAKEPFFKEFDGFLFDRMLTYVFTNNTAKIPDSLIFPFYQKYPDVLTKLMAAFGENMLPRMQTILLPYEELVKYPHQLLSNTYMLFSNSHFKTIEDINSFLLAVRQNKPDWTIEDICKLTERHYITSIKFPEDMSVYGKEGPWVYFSKKSCLMVNRDKWPNYIDEIVKDIDMLSAFAVCFTTGKIDVRAFFNDAKNGEMLSKVVSYVHDSFMSLYIKIDGETEDAKKERISVESYAHMQLLEVMTARLLFIPDTLFDLAKNTIFTKNILSMVERVQNENKFFRFSDAQLEELLEIADVSSVLKLSRIDKNFDFINSHLGTLYVDLPPQIVNCYSMHDTNWEWVWNNVGKEGKQTFPFPLWFMRKNKERFTPYLCNLNTDRYIAAYGINWVEENGTISISDMVKANVLRDEKVAERYLDIILLDDLLRTLFLHPKNFGSNHMNKDSILDKVLNSDTFNSNIKCHCIFTYIMGHRPLYEHDRQYCTRFLRYVKGSGEWELKLLLLISKVTGKVFGVK